MKKIVLFGLPLIALVFAVACKKAEVAPVTEAPAAVAGTAVETPVAAPVAVTPAPVAAPKTEKKGK
jgi:hypothetical protein